MVKFKEQKMSLQKISVVPLIEETTDFGTDCDTDCGTECSTEEVTLKEEKKVEGYASKLCVEIDEMLPLILNNGQINQQIERYEVSFTVNDNKIYGVNRLAVETYTQTGWESVESVESGEDHIVRIESEFIFIVFFS